MPAPQARVRAAPPTNPKKPLSADQERIVRTALADGATRDEAAALAGITRRLLDTRLNDQLLDLRVGQGRRERHRGAQSPEDAGANRSDPTPGEIEWRCYLVRRNWTPDRWGIPAAEIAEHLEPGRHGRIVSPP